MNPAVRALVEEDGWHPGIARAHVEDPGFAPRLEALNSVMAVVADEIRRGGDVPELSEDELRKIHDFEPDATLDEIIVEAWNEKAGRTHKQVLALLDSAIARMERTLAARAR